MKHLFGVFLLALAGPALLLAGCGDDDGPGSSRRDPRTILIPSEMSLEEAGDQAVAGDTLHIADLVITLTETVEFRRSQTPLLIRGTKNYPLITILDDAPPLRFVNPEPGTRVESLLFGAPGTGIDCLPPDRDFH